MIAHGDHLTIRKQFEEHVMQMVRSLYLLSPWRPVAKGVAAFVRVEGESIPGDHVIGADAMCIEEFIQNRRGHFIDPILWCPIGDVAGPAPRPGGNIPLFEWGACLIARENSLVRHGDT